jgi:hypothetical protein
VPGLERADGLRWSVAPPQPKSFTAASVSEACVLNFDCSAADREKLQKPLCSLEAEPTAYIVSGAAAAAITITSCPRTDTSRRASAMNRDMKPAQKRDYLISAAIAVVLVVLLRCSAMPSSE